MSVTGYSLGENNSVDIVQNGDDSSLDIVQNGADNIIEASQSGGVFYNSTYDSGVISQTGTANFASLNQHSPDGDLGANSAIIMQNGIGNSATVTQR